MKTELDEINEAIYSGEIVVDKINDIKSSLRNAKIWGAIDMFSKKGGLITSLLKHNSLDAAQSQMNSLQHSLARFNDELGDVKVYSDFHDIAMSQGAKFADWFFDGFLIDAYTLSHIVQSEKELDQLKDKVETVIDRLAYLKTNLYG